MISDCYACFPPGTSLLPPHLEFFAFSQEELSARDDCRQSTEGKHKRSRNREGTPDSSSSDGGNDDMTEDTGGVATPPLVSHCVGGGGCCHEKCILSLVVHEKVRGRNTNLG